MRRSVLVLLAMLLSATSLADNSDVAAFNNAWQEYVAAEELDDTDLRVETAARVVEAGKRVFTEVDEQLTLVTHNYGVAISDSGDRKQATSVLKEALRLGELVYGGDDSRLIPILADLADAEAETFESATQLRHYRRALKIAKANFGQQSVEYADLAFRTSRNVYTMSRSPNAKRYMSDAREIYASLPEPKTQNVALADFYLGKMEFTERDYRHSSEYLESALTGFEAPGDANQALRLLTRALLVQAYEHRGLSDEATQHCVAIGRDSQISPNQDYEPIFRVAPMYPASMLRAGRSGYVDIEFTVDEHGFVREPAVIARKVSGKERTSSSAFDKVALDAVNAFRYAPKFVDGEAVAATGVKTRISFTIER